MNWFIDTKDYLTLEAQQCPSGQIDLSSWFNNNEMSFSSSEYFLIVCACNGGPLYMKQISSLILGRLKMFSYYAARFIGAVKAKSY